jgi:hypothetical protein
MSVSSVLARGRAAVLQLMVDTCLIERKTGRTWDDVTGDYTDVWTTIYTGPCHLKKGGGGDSQFGEHEATLNRYPVSLPWDPSVEIKREDRLTITTSADDWLIGRPMEVVDIDLNALATARRIVVEDRIVEEVRRG